jgi:hypothetical protein
MVNPAGLSLSLLDEMLRRSRCRSAAPNSRLVNNAEGSKGFEFSHKRSLWRPLTNSLLGLLDQDESNLRTDGGENLAAPPSDVVASIRILIWADHISVSVAVAAVVVVVVIAVGPYRSGSDRSGSDRCRTIGRTSIGTAIGRATINPSGSRRARYRAACDGAGHVGVSPGMHSPAPDVGGTHATPVEASATTETAASTSASERVVGN